MCGLDLGGQCGGVAARAGPRQGHLATGWPADGDLAHKRASACGVEAHREADVLPRPAGLCAGGEVQVQHRIVQ